MTIQAKTQTYTMTEALKPHLSADWAWEDSRANVRSLKAPPKRTFMTIAKKASHPWAEAWNMSVSPSESSSKLNPS